MDDKVVLSGITRFSIYQALKWLELEFNKFSRRQLGTIKLTQGIDKLRLLDVIEDRTGDGSATIKKDIQYPFMLAAVADISLDTERAGFKKNHATGGFLATVNREKGKAMFEDVRPIKLALGLAFRTDSIDEILSMATVLLYNAPKVAFIMKGQDNYVVETSLNIDGTFSVPPISSDTGEAFIFETQVILNTHIGIARQTGVIKQIKFSVMHENLPEEFAEGDGDLLFQELIDYKDLFTPGNSHYKKGLK